MRDWRGQPVDIKIRTSGWAVQSPPLVQSGNVILAVGDKMGRDLSHPWSVGTKSSVITQPGVSGFGLVRRGRLRGGRSYGFGVIPPSSSVSWDTDLLPEFTAGATDDFDVDAVYSELETLGEGASVQNDYATGLPATAADAPNPVGSPSTSLTPSATAKASIDSPAVVPMPTWWNPLTWFSWGSDTPPEGLPGYSASSNPVVDVKPPTPTAPVVPKPDSTTPTSYIEASFDQIKSLFSVDEIRALAEKVTSLVSAGMSSDQALSQVSAEASQAKAKAAGTSADGSSLVGIGVTLAKVVGSAAGMALPDIDKSVKRLEDMFTRVLEAALKTAAAQFMPWIVGLFIALALIAWGPGSLRTLFGGSKS